MGGDREAFLEKGPGPQAAGPETTVTQGGGNGVRFHQSAGQIHFHDDARKLKVAVPAAKWWKAWDHLQSALPGEPRRFSYSSDNAVLLINTTCEYPTAGAPYVFKATIEIDPATQDRNFTELQRFTLGGSPQ